MKIFVLDDDIDRIKAFQNYFGDEVVDYSNNSREAAEKLRNNEYDQIFLDHDLGVFDNGSLLSITMAEEKLCVDVPIVIHSMNVVGAINMEEILKNTHNNVVRVNFSLLLKNLEASMKKSIEYLYKISSFVENIEYSFIIKDIAKRLEVSNCSTKRWNKIASKKTNASLKLNDVKTVAGSIYDLYCLSHLVGNTNKKAGKYLNKAASNLLDYSYKKDMIKEAGFWEELKGIGSNIAGIPARMLGVNFTPQIQQQIFNTIIGHVRRKQEESQRYLELIRQQMRQFVALKDEAGRKDKKTEITQTFLNFLRNIQDQKLIQNLMSEGAKATYRGDAINLAVIRNYIDVTRALSQQYEAAKAKGINFNFVTQIMGQTIQSLQDIQIQDFGIMMRNIRQQEAYTDVMRAQEAKMRGRGGRRVRQPPITGYDPNAPLDPSMVAQRDFGVSRERAAKFLQSYPAGRSILDALGIPRGWEQYTEATKRQQYPKDVMGADKEMFKVRLMQFIKNYGQYAEAYLSKLGIPIRYGSWPEQARQTTRRQTGYKL